MRTNDSPEIILNKMKNWCAYQERSQQETRSKLYTFKLEQEVSESIIAALISENFLNEERFALAFAGGKFRMKNWGRIKIQAELRKHRISDFLINKALKSLDEAEYENVIKKVIVKRIDAKDETNHQKQFYSVLNYLVSRGFEANLVIAQLKNINKNIEI